MKWSTSDNRHGHTTCSQLSLLSQLAFLDLSGCGLTAVPAPVAALPALQRLNLEGNSLSGLPREVRCPGLAVWPVLFVCGALLWLCGLAVCGEERS